MKQNKQQGHYVVTVDFEVQAVHAEQFAELLIANATASRTLEPGCLQFDVCSAAANNVFFLYEVYQNAAAFEAHKQTTHFKTFDAQVKDWTIRKVVKTLSRIDPIG